MNQYDMDAATNGNGHWRRLRMTLGCAVAMTSLASASPASAQSALERNLPPALAARPASVSIGEQDFGNASSEPLGVDLSGVHLIGEGEPVAGSPQPGITGTPQGADAGAIAEALLPFLDRPLSLELAADIQAAIAGVYRAAGHPFVSVTLPPQEITSGVLQVRVIEFRLGTVTVSGLNDARAARIRAVLRVVPGERIDARALDEDLTWINRSPYLTAEGMFRPGTETALTDLQVPVTQARPVFVSAGWSNTGSEATGRDRYFLGFEAGLASLNGAWMSYRVTGGEDLWRDRSRLVPQTGDYPAYLSHAARFVMPTWPRQALEISPNYVVSREAANAFTTFENATFELPIVYRSAISNIAPGHYWGDIYAGLEFKTLRRTTFFAGTNVATGSADLFQFVLGWSNAFADPHGRTVIDASVVINPGGVLSGNDAATWSTFSNGRVTDITYAYVSGSVTRSTTLPRRFSWLSTATGQFAGQALPDTERMSPGGFSAVRGYALDDVSVDRGLVWRNELRFPSLSPLAEKVGQPDWLSPFVFTDLGAGTDLASGTDTTMASLGAGADYSFGNHLSVNVAAGYAMKDAGATNAGDWMVNAFIKASF